MYLQESLASSCSSMRCPGCSSYWVRVTRVLESGDSLVSFTGGWKGVAGKGGGWSGWNESGGIERERRWGWIPSPPLYQREEKRHRSVSRRGTRNSLCGRLARFELQGSSEHREDRIKKGMKVYKERGKNMKEGRKVYKERGMNMKGRKG